MKKFIFSLLTLAIFFPLFAETAPSPLVATLRLSPGELFPKDQLSPKNKKVLENAIKKEWDEFGDPMDQEIYRVDLDGDGTWEYVVRQVFQNDAARLTVLEGEEGRILFQDEYPKGEESSIGFTSLVAPKQKEILFVYQGGFGTGHFGFTVDVLKKNGKKVKKIFENYFYYYDWSDKEYEEISYIALAGIQRPYQLQIFEGRMKNERRNKIKNKDDSGWNGGKYNKLLTIPLVRKSENDIPKEIYVWDAKDYEYRKMESKKIK